MPSAVGRPRKIKNEPWLKNETDSSNASESDNDEIEILSASVSDAVITLSDEESQNNSMEDSGISLNEGSDGTEAAKEDQEGSGGVGEEDRDTAEFVKSLIESPFWFTVSGANEGGSDRPNEDKEAATHTAEASKEDVEVVCVADEEVVDISGAQDPKDDDVQLIISDELDARSGSAGSDGTESNVSMVKSIIKEILNNVMAAAGTSSATVAQGRETIVPVETIGIDDQGDKQNNETIVPVPVAETIGIDEDDIVALDIAEDDGIAVLSEVSHNEIWSLPEIIMLDD